VTFTLDLKFRINDTECLSGTADSEYVLPRVCGEALCISRFTSPYFLRIRVLIQGDLVGYLQRHLKTTTTYGKEEIQKMS
jgi:hypothetical protein